MEEVALYFSMGLPERLFLPVHGRTSKGWPALQVFGANAVDVGKEGELACLSVSQRSRGREETLIIAADCKLESVAVGHHGLVVFREGSQPYQILHRSVPALKLTRVNDLRADDPLHRLVNFSLVHQDSRIEKE